MAWDVSEMSLSLEAVLVYTFAFMVFLIFLFEFRMKSGKGFVGSSGNESRQNHASNVGIFRCKVCWSQHVFNSKPCKHVILAASFCTDEAQEEPVA